MKTRYQKSSTSSTSMISKLLGYVFGCGCLCAKPDEMSFLDTQIQKHLFDVVFDDPLLPPNLSPEMDYDYMQSPTSKNNP